MAVMAESKQELITALNDYIDADALYNETVKEIARLQRRKGTVIQDSVKGSMPDFPYAAKNFHIAGIVYSPQDDECLRNDEAILAERARIAGETKRKVEMYMNRIPSRMQRIIKYKIFEGEAWEEVAARLGRGATGDSVRMEYKRFVEFEEQ